MSDDILKEFALKFRLLREKTEEAAEVLRLSLERRRLFNARMAAFLDAIAPTQEERPPTSNPADTTKVDGG